MWILNFPIKDHRDRPRQLQVHIIVISDICFCPKLLEKFGHAIQVVEHQLWQCLKVRIKFIFTLAHLRLLQKDKQIGISILIKLRLL